MENPNQYPPARLSYQIAAFAVVRTVLNTGYRMIYPFIPAIARGLGVDITAITLVAAARSTLGMFNPLIASVADWKGRKAGVLIGLGLFAVSMVGVAVWPIYPVFLIGMVIAAAGKYIFDAAMQAYLGDHVPYRQRGLAVAVTEMSWSLAFLIGIPLLGLLIAYYDWRAPLPWLGLLGLIGGLVMWRMLPADAVRAAGRLSLAQGLRTVLTHPPALAALAVGVLITASNEMVAIIYGAWMENAFGLQVAALGAASMVIGLAELGGEGLVAAIVDRLGKRRSVAVGIGLSVLSCLALLLMGKSLIGALAGLFLFYLTFEFSLVASIPLVTELVPDARATLVAAFGASLTAGRVIGDVLGPALFGLGAQQTGLPLLANTLVSAALNGIALAALLGFVKTE